jgi:phosphopantothenoylcysteine decarboxylase/phosphopantothenate--cysteine ligase
MKILFIITASIAIQKCFDILKQLTSNQISIDCIVTNNAKKMVSLKNFQKIITGKVFTNNSEINNKMLHIKLTRKSDLVVVCPATANIIAKFANGYADDLASTSLIASNKQIIFIPAMNSEMWNNSVNQKNVSRLIDIGVEFIGPEYGRLSCGEIGLGRLTESKKIHKILIQNLNKSQIFKNKKCLITAGPTIEPIDAFRYLSNYSSGKQGYEIAKQMILSGARVTLVSGPTKLQHPFKSKLIKVITAKEMLKAVKKNSKVDIVIFTAAVSDAAPKKIIKTKIKKEDLKNISLKKNKDILHEVSSLKKNRPKIVVGFAAETNNHIKNATKKLISKNCDAIIVNKIDKNNEVFGSDLNKVSFITKKSTIHFKKMTKVNVAKKVIELINEISINQI